MNDPRKILSVSIITDDLRQALERAAARMQVSAINIITPEMALAVFAGDANTGAYRLLRRIAATGRFDWADLLGRADLAAENNEAADAGLDFQPADGSVVPVGAGLVEAIHAGLSIARERGETRCGTEHVLIGIAGAANTAAGRILAHFGITPEEVISLLPGPADPESSAAAVDHVAVARAGGGAPVYPRLELLAEILNLLSLHHAGNVLLVGPVGAGKRSLAYALAQRLAEVGAPRFTSLVEINEQSLLDNPVVAIRAGARAARGGILFVPHIDRFFGGYRAEFPAPTGAELQKVFLDPAVAVLGTCTPERYRERLEGDFTVARTSATLEVPPATIAETTRILEMISPAFEAYYARPVDPGCLPEAARLAGRYLSALPLPGAAVHLLHRACAGETGPLNAAGLRQAVVHLTGIPVAEVNADERVRYAAMADHLHRAIVGQDEAVQALSRAVQAARLGLKSPRRPVGSFLFTGPTGVGKSELAKALARFMFGTEEALLALDMSEYMDKSSVTRLIGSPPGYIGSGDGGWLTNAVKHRPHSVILFDEVEKADERVFDLLLQILDEGRLTSGQGETVSFSECVVLMTSNLGQTSDRDQAEAALRTHFRPEFLNRLDGVIPFQALTPEQMGQVLALLLAEEAALLAERAVSLTVSPQARAWLLDRNTHPEWGARPLRRIIHEYVRAPLVDYLLRQDLAQALAVKVDAKDDKLNFCFD